jgi:hypothetical protein
MVMYLGGDFIEAVRGHAKPCEGFGSIMQGSILDVSLRRTGHYTKNAVRFDSM